MEPSPLDRLYTPLDPSRKEIRLLRILSTGPCLTCTLQVASLTQDLYYHALSYVWGDPAAEHEILVNETAIKIAGNLYHALHDVFGLFEDGNFENNPQEPGRTASAWDRARRLRGSDKISSGQRYLWVDALCINQRDIPEKNTQIPLMADIYRDAALVLSWLGPRSELLSRSMDSFSFLYDEIHEIDWNVPEKDPMGWLEKYPQHHYISDSGSWNKTIRALLKHVAARDYWTRVWVFQELALSRQCLLFSSDKAIGLAQYMCVLQWLEIVLLRYPSGTPPKGFDTPGWEAFCQTCPPVHFLRYIKEAKKTIDYIEFQSRYLMLQEAALQQGLEMPAELVDRDLRAGAPDRRRLQIFDKIPYFRATDKRDYVYGLCGMLSLDLAVDYCTSNTVGMVYRGFIELWFAHPLTWKNPFIEAIVGTGSAVPDYECIHLMWFLRYAGVGHSWKVLTDVPSWVPNFAGPSECPQEYLEYYDRMDFNTIVGTFDGLRGHAELSGPFLCCPAVLIDHIEDCGPPIKHSTAKEFDYLSQQPTTKPLMTDDDWMKWIFDYLRSVQKYPVDMHPCAAVYWVLCHFNWLDDPYPTLYDCFPLICWLGIRRANKTERFFDVVARDLGIGKILWQKFDKSTYFEIADHNLAKARARSPYLRQHADIIKEYRVVNNVTRYRPHLDQIVLSFDDRRKRHVSLVSILAKLCFEQSDSFRMMALAFSHEVQRKGSSRLGRTSEGYVGLFPVGTQKGDVVCLLKDGMTPCLLRKTGEDYLFVGTCFVAGLMHGEAAERVKNGEKKVETVRIR